MDPMTLAFPPQETRKKFIVTVRFKRQQEAKWVIFLLLRRFQSLCRGLRCKRNRESSRKERWLGGQGHRGPGERLVLLVEAGAAYSCRY